MELRSYAKINLTLDVIGRRDDGYHNISSLMQNIGLYDVINIEKCLKSGTKYKTSHCMISNVGVYLCTCDNTIPVGDDNLAIKGARAVLASMERDEISHDIKEIYILIDKRLPVAAGIAGGSGNAAVTMLGINAMAGYPYNLRELMNIGAKVGADVPYSIMMNARNNAEILSELPGIQEASNAAMTSGIGDVVEPVEPIHRYVIMTNPGIAVSTKEAYQAIDNIGDYSHKTGLFTNQFEEYTLANYPQAKALKDAMENNLHAESVLMSGSGPTMVAYYTEREQAEADFSEIEKSGWLCEGWRAWLTETGSSR